MLGSSRLEHCHQAAVPHFRRRALATCNAQQDSKQARCTVALSENNAATLTAVCHIVMLRFDECRRLRPSSTSPVR
jgi:hypothetical protein